MVIDYVLLTVTHRQYHKGLKENVWRFKLQCPQCHMYVAREWFMPHLNRIDYYLSCDKPVGFNSGTAGITQYISYWSGALLYSVVNFDRLK